MECKICKHQTNEIFKADVLLKYKVAYHQCSYCQFIQTDETYWLGEAYKEAISSLDIGYLTRNILYSEITANLLQQFYKSNEPCLDYGGGYGMFVRLMRDKGFHFYRQDLYCENLFAKYLDITELGSSTPQKFELVTAFEVFEHLENPLAEIEQMFGYSNSILFSTELQPDMKFTTAADWWYFVPESGQHIALFSKESLKEICSIFNCNLYSNGNTLHLLTRRSFKKDPVQLVTRDQDRMDRKLKRNFSNPNSLIQHDFQLAKQKLVERNS
jgi:2-polyprenyl-3-methyl-5-hydroxy-6-metoxy-1,4-benzoquinol methylase